jgi:hypothetical protein
MSWSGWPDPLPKGKATYDVSIRGKRNAVKAGVAAASLASTKKAALKWADRELNKFMTIAPQTATVSGKIPTVVFENPPVFRKRYVRGPSGSGVLFDCFYRLYLHVKVSA